MTFTDAELGVIASLVREKLRKIERNRRTLVAKHGGDYDPTQQDRKVALLESIYRQTGHDPANITNRPLAPHRQLCDNGAMPTPPLVVLWSREAFVEPTVQVHARTCQHVERRLSDPAWSTGTIGDEAATRAFADAKARSIGSPNVAWMDCSL